MMNNHEINFRHFFLTVILFASFLSGALTPANSQTTVVTEIREPGIYNFSDLYKSADVVATVRVLAGDAESYDSAVYKAVVVRTFKGIRKDEILYFGPFIGTRLGNDYLLFLKRNPVTIKPKDPSSKSFGEITVWNVFNEGYSQMEVAYQCNFPGKDPHQTCDYAIRVCTDYIHLPLNVETAPGKEIATDFGCRWARKSAIERELEKLGPPEMPFVEPHKLN